MTFWTPESLRSSCGGVWLVRPPQMELPKDRPVDLPLPPLHAPITGVCTDTRSIKPGQVFIALRGERFDGHQFLKAAVAAGSPIIIIDEAGAAVVEPYEPVVGVMKVADTGKALMRIAAAYRKSLERTRVIAVCGSNGKTTTTSLIKQVLTGCGLRGTASPKSYNNAVGVPLTILSTQPTDQFLICEVGTNAPGEIAQLAEIVNPDIAVITSIGREHLERLGDLAGVAREEASVFKFLKAAPKGCAIVTADAPELSEHLKNVGNVITFGRNAEADLRLTGVRHVFEGSWSGVEFVINDRMTCRVGLIGEHNAMNALGALAVARRMGIDDQKAIAALATASGPEMRLQREMIAVGGMGGAGGVEVLNDAYNANPDSMIAGLHTVVALARDRSPAPVRVVAVLADMLEMGSAADEGHRSIGRALIELGAQKANPKFGLVVLCGPTMKRAHDLLLEAGWPPSTVVHLAEMDDHATQRVSGLLRAGDLVLLKGSRRMRLERVVDALRSRFPQGQQHGEVGGGGEVMAEVKGVPAMAG